MTRTTRLAATLGLAALILSVAVLPLTGCGGSDASGGRKLPKAQAYYDEATKTVYCVPFGRPAKEQVWPPIVNPDTGERTLVRAYFYESKETGKPELYYLSRYTDKQIKIFNKAQARLTDDDHTESVEVDLAPETEAFEMEVKYAGEDTWRKLYGKKRQDKDDRKERTKRFNKPYRPVIDPTWRVLKPEEIKQWK